MTHRRLGSASIADRLEGDVNVAEIQIFPLPFKVDKETMVGGAAPKSIIEVPQQGARYIAKAPSKGNSTALECVTEEIISRIGRWLPLSVARSCLAILPGPGPTPDVRFMSRVFLRRGEEQLRHGIDLFAASLAVEKAQMVQEIPPGGKAERCFYTVELVDEVLQATGRNPQERTALRNGFARMLAFDALVGTNDRHSENWGVVENVLQTAAPLRFAPIYDTARGLFWNLRDEQLRHRSSSEMERKVLIEGYANRSAPLITTGNPRDSHFDVVQGVMLSHPVLKPSVRHLIASFKPDEVRALLHRRFGRLLSRLRLELIDQLLRYRYGKLRRITEV